MNCCRSAVFPTSSSPRTTTLTGRLHSSVTVSAPPLLPPPSESLMHAAVLSGLRVAAAAVDLIGDDPPSSHWRRRRRLMESPRFTSAPCPRTSTQPLTHSLTAPVSFTLHHRLLTNANRQLLLCFLWEHILPRISVAKQACYIAVTILPNCSSVAQSVRPSVVPLLS